MSKSVLVTGAAGFIGRALLPALEQHGYRAVPHLRSDGDLSAGPPAAPAADWVVHLAGRTFVPESWTNPLAFYRDNTLATAGVLDYCRRTGARLLHMSSYVYGTPEQLPISEAHARRAFNPYGLSKILAEDLIHFHQAELGLGATVIRPFNLYGPGQDARFLIPSLVRQTADPACARISVSDLRPKRDYLHVDDLVRLVIAAIGSEAGGVYNAGSGSSVSVADLIDVLAGISGVRKPVDVTGAPRQGEVLDVIADRSLAERVFGWRPAVPLRDGLTDLLAHAARSADREAH